MFDHEIKLSLKRVSLDCATLLQEELNRRTAKNPKYSLRAFARSLGLSPATLSLLITRKTPLSKKSLGKIAVGLGLSPEQVHHLRQKIGKGKTAEDHIKRDESNYRYVTLDIFKTISHWHYYAILSLLELKDSTIDPKWISKKLGISRFEAKDAVERLQRLELIGEKRGRWRQASMPLRIDDESSTAAARSFQKQLLMKAMESLENDSVKIRDFSAMTLAISQKDIAYAVDKITEFRRALTKDLESRNSPDAVYNLSIQFFPFTKEQS